MQPIRVMIAALAGVSALTAAELSSCPAPTKQVISLNGTWAFEPVGTAAREVTAPGFWDKLP